MYIQVIQLYEHPVISFITQNLKQVYKMQCDSISSFFKKTLATIRWLNVYTIGPVMTFQSFNKFISIKNLCTKCKECRVKQRSAYIHKKLTDWIPKLTKENICRMSIGHLNTFSAPGPYTSTHK